MKFPVPVYGDVPPLPLTVTVDVPPLQRIAVADDDAESAVGSEMVTEVIAVHPFASVTV